ncbi:MAG: hypothetical protein IKY31_01895 [Bacteroidaceae bacterium]|nr:hypothetical protein [Bacteroidaceae bacterium]
MKKYRKQEKQNLTLQKMGHPTVKNTLTYTIKNHAVHKVIDYKLIEEAIASECFSHKHLVFETGITRLIHVRHIPKRSITLHCNVQ